MKKLFYISTMISLFTFSVSAKSRSGTSKPVITHGLSTTKTYKQLLDDIKRMKPKQVISPENTLSDYFITFIKDNVQKANLSSVATESLLQAGMNLYMPFSEDNKQALQTIQKNNLQIKTIIDSLFPTAQAEQQKPLPLKPEEKPSVRPTPPPVEQKKELSGIEKLQEFSRTSATEPMEKVYANATFNQQWLEKALSLILNGAPLTTQNKEQIRGELLGNATELMRALLSKNNITGQTRSIILESTEKQVITFLNNQPLQDQKPSPLSSLSEKKPSPQPIMVPAPKKAVAEPNKKTDQKPEEKPIQSTTSEMSLQLPAWISKDHTFIANKFEVEMLGYIFKHDNATEKDVLDHFSQQLPAQISNKEIIINAMKVIIANTFKDFAAANTIASPQKPQKTTSSKISQKNLPSWLDAESFNIARTDLIHEIMNYFAKHTDADNEEILNHVMKQLPADIPDRKMIQGQVRAIIETVFEQ